MVAERRGKTEREAYPDMSSLRDIPFYRDHLFSIDDLTTSFESTDTPTLTQLVYAFFEYFGFRFNFATDVSKHIPASLFNCSCSRPLSVERPRKL